MEEKLKLAKGGDIKAFNELFGAYEQLLKSYLYRLLTNREDVEDYYHNTFVKAFDNIDSFQGNLAQFKSWIFTIATNISLNFLKRKKRWDTQAQDHSRNNMESQSPEDRRAFFGNIKSMPYAEYEIKEHIDFCFTCISNTLPYKQQLVLILKEVYQFKLKEIAEISTLSLGQVKHALLGARNTMKEIYNKKCALINKEGTCYQCSELQGILNPKRDKHRALMDIEMVRQSNDLSDKKLFVLRTELIRAINPLKNNGADLHDSLMQQVKKINGLDSDRF